MSRVYKQNQIILGEEKQVKIQINPVIKSDENIHLGITGDVQTQEQVNKEAKAIIAEARDEAYNILQNAQLEYDKILNVAKEEGEALISEAYTKSSQILESARNEGYHEGLKQGQESGLNKVDYLIEEAKEIKENALLEKEAMVKSLEGQMIDLVIACVKKIIDYELEKDHQLLLNLVEKGINKCIYTDGLIIRVSTNNYEIVNASKNKIYMMTEGIDRIDVKKDPALKDGSIIIETTSGTVEASIQTQIAQIEQVFNDIFKGE